MTLQRAVDCSHKEAVDFATMVDREVISYHIQPRNLQASKEVVHELEF